MILMLVFSFQQLEVTEKEKLLPENQDMNAAQSSDVNVPMDQIVSETEPNAPESIGGWLEVADVTVEETVTQSCCVTENSDTSAGNQMGPTKQLTGEQLPSGSSDEDTTVPSPASVEETSQVKENHAEEKVEGK